MCVKYVFIKPDVATWYLSRVFTIGVISDRGSYLLDQFTDITFTDLKILLKYVMGIQQISSVSTVVL